jgi:hypothetical protein
MGRPGSSAARVRRPLTAAPPSRIGEGLGLLDRALRRQRPGPYQLQAAIAAQHALAARAADTDWRQIAALYAELLRLRPSPTYELNRAVAVAMAYGPDAGLALLDGWRRPGRWPATTCWRPPGPTWSVGPAAPPSRRPPTDRLWSWPPTRSSAATSAVASIR